MTLDTQEAGKPKSGVVCLPEVPFQQLATVTTPNQELFKIRQSEFLSVELGSPLPEPASQAQALVR